MAGSWVRSTPAGSGIALFDKEKVSDPSCGPCRAFLPWLLPQCMLTALPDGTGQSCPCCCCDQLLPEGGVHKVCELISGWHACLMDLSVYSSSSAAAGTCMSSAAPSCAKGPMITTACSGGLLPCWLTTTRPRSVDVSTASTYCCLPPARVTLAGVTVGLCILPLTMCSGGVWC